MKKLVLSILALLGAAVVPALAHHAFSAEFDLKKPIDVKGVVTKIEWMNPHAWIYVDVKTDAGVEHWQFETGAPIELVRRGWRKNDLKVGDEVSGPRPPRQGWHQHGQRAHGHLAVRQKSI